MIGLAFAIIYFVRFYKLGDDQLLKYRRAGKPTRVLRQRMKIPLNDGWAFSPAFTDEQVSPAFDDSGFERFVAPHRGGDSLQLFRRIRVSDGDDIPPAIVLDDVYPRQAVLVLPEGAAHAAECILTVKSW